MRRTAIANGTFRNAQHGTTLEEMLRVCVERLQELNGRFSSRENALAITKMQEVVQAILSRLAGNALDERHPHWDAAGWAEWMLRFWRYYAVLVGVGHDCCFHDRHLNRHNSKSEISFLQRWSVETATEIRTQHVAVRPWAAPEWIQRVPCYTAAGGSACRVLRSFYPDNPRSRKKRLEGPKRGEAPHEGWPPVIPSNQSGSPEVSSPKLYNGPGATLWQRPDDAAHWKFLCTGTVPPPRSRDRGAGQFSARAGLARDDRPSVPSIFQIKTRSAVDTLRTPDKTRPLGMRALPAKSLILVPTPGFEPGRSFRPNGF